jgi:hypothetical protein
VSLNSTNPASGFSLYPNPTSGNFTLRQTENQPNSSVSLVIFSNRGELVHSETLTSKPEHQIRFSEVAPGLYFVRIITQDSTEIIKLVKTR